METPLCTCLLCPIWGGSGECSALAFHGLGISSHPPDGAKGGAGELFWVREEGCGRCAREARTGLAGRGPSFWLLPPTQATLLAVSPQSGLSINDEEVEREVGNGEERPKQGLG